jgi:hypothetical protein
MSVTKEVLFAVAACAAALQGCGGDDKPPANTGQLAATQCPPGQYFDGRLCQVQGGVPGAATTPAPGMPAPTTATPAPAATPTVPVATAAAGPTATPLDPAAAQAITPLLIPLGQQSAMSGARAVGPVIAGNFQQGQSLESTVQMNPGKCYTIVGVALPTVQNLDITLVPAISIPGMPAAVAASDSTVGPQAVVAGKPNCFKWALPIGGTMKLIMTVSSGQGAAAAQVFEK